MKTRLARGTAAVLALTLAVAACSDDATDATDDAEATTTTADATTTEATTAEEATTTEEEDDTTTTAEADVETGTIVDVATEAGSFTILLAAVEAADLTDTLDGGGPFTLFAPTDEAFEAALAELGLTADELLASPDLADILTYHVIEGEVFAADVVELDGESVTTVNGAEVQVTVDGDTVMIGDATVVTTDIQASNGVIHVIDTVLIP